MSTRGSALVRGIVALVALRASAVRADTMTPEDLARKNEGGYVTGLPLFAYSTDIGVGVGARAYYYWDGDKADPRFATSPYLQRIFAQAFISTRGLQFHWLDYDAPRILDTKWRVRSQLIYYRAINQNYFGLGDAAAGELHYTGSTKSYAKYDDYLADQSRIIGNTTYAKYDQYDLQRPIWVMSLERLILDDRVRVLGGFGFSYATIRDYTGKTVDATGGSATEAPTRLTEDCVNRAVLVGCSGGWDNYLRLGVSYDTRDFEPDPNNGVYADLALDAGTKALGSEYQYVRVLGAVRGYWSPDPEAADLVLAGRAVIDVQTKGTPFFSMDVLPFTEDPRSGLGGHRTMRGFKQDRFVGRAMTLLNAEVRWTFTHFTIKHQKFALIAAPFLDTGRAFDGATDLGFHQWRLSYGGALRVSWNLATLVTVDYGRSSEDTGFYVNFGHIF